MENKIAILAREHKLRKFSASFTPGMDDPTGWRDQIEFTWNEGRHGETDDEITITSTKRVFAKLTAGKEND